MRASLFIFSFDMEAKMRKAVKAVVFFIVLAGVVMVRSEERRVGKECL